MGNGCHFITNIGDAVSIRGAKEPAIGLDWALLPRGQDGSGVAPCLR